MSGRVVEPTGALAHRATRLDPVAPPGPGERRLDLEALVVGDDAGRLRGAGAASALVHAVQDRGGLPDAAVGSALVGALDGTRVVLLGPLAPVPLWVIAAQVDRDGSDVLLLTGHAVVTADTPLVHAAALAPRAAVAGAVGARVRRRAADGRGPLLVLGDPRHLEDAVLGGLGAGRAVVAVADGLAAAQRLAGLGARVVVDLGATASEAVARLGDALGAGREEVSALVLGATPPVADPDGRPVDTRTVDLAGTLAAVVEVVGSVEVAGLAARTGAQVVQRALADRPRAEVGPGGPSWG